MESWRCWCALVVPREAERERDENFFYFAERGKAREGESLKNFPAVMLGSGCGALELRERESEDSGAGRESRNRERVLILLKKGKWVLRRRFEIFQVYICLCRCIRYGMLIYFF